MRYLRPFRMPAIKDENPAVLLPVRSLKVRHTNYLSFVIADRIGGSTSQRSRENQCVCVGWSAAGANRMKDVVTSRDPGAGHGTNPGLMRLQARPALVLVAATRRVVPRNGR